MSIFGWFQGRGPSGFGYNSTAEQVSEGLDLTGKTYLLTGCNSGLGRETMRVLTLRGATVLGAARTLEKAQEACTAAPGSAIPIACELSEPESVRAAVAQIRDREGPLDGIIANAGIMALPERTVKHGVELQLLTNHVGHFLLVTGLMNRLTSNGRVVMVSSEGHRFTYNEGVRLDDLAADRGYRDWLAYGQSKLANVLFARELTARLPASQTANAVHPGVIPTNLGRHMGGFLNSVLENVGPAVATKSIPQGAATQTYVATHPQANHATAEYYLDCNRGRASTHGRSDELAKALWRRTEELVAKLP